MPLVFNARLPACGRVAIAGPARGLHADVWLRGLLAEGGRTARLRGTWERETDAGWPMRFRVFALGADETALVADYRFFDLLAEVVVDGLGADALEAHGEELVAALSTARPDWNAGEPLVISDLWAEG